MKNIYWCEDLEMLLVEEVVDGRRVMSGHRTKDWEDLEMDVVRVGATFYDREYAVLTTSGLCVYKLVEVK